VCVTCNVLHVTDEFDEDPDSPKSGGSGGFSAQNQAATVLQKIGRAKLARAAAEKRKREKAEVI